MNRRGALKGLAVVLVAVVFLPVFAGTASAGPPTMRVTGGGEAIAAAFVEYVGHDGVVRKVRSINTIGNRITFGFVAMKDGSGNVAGQMQLVDHDLDLVIHSDVASLVFHPVHRAPVGATGVVPSLRFSSSTASVTINGVPQPGWRLMNTPVYDGGEGASGTGDTVCFELFDAAGVLVRQWSAILSSGNVQVTA